MPDTTDVPTDPGSGPRLTRRQVVQRLAVGGAIVWTAPLISRTAYAASASSCEGRTIDWNGFAVGTTFTSTVVAGTTVSLASSFHGGSSALGTNHQVMAGPQGGAPGRALRFEQTPRSGGGQRIVLSFSQTVYNVSFTITDIDNSTDGGWSDRIVVMSPADYTFAFATGTRLRGNGTATATTTTNGPFRNQDTNVNLPNSSNQGNVTLTFPGPLTSFDLDFRCASTANGTNQLINITNISFCA